MSGPILPAQILCRWRSAGLAEIARISAQIPVVGSDIEACSTGVRHREPSDALRFIERHLNATPLRAAIQQLN